MTFSSSSSSSADLSSTRAMNALLMATATTLAWMPCATHAFTQSPQFHAFHHHQASSWALASAVPSDHGSPMSNPFASFLSPTTTRAKKESSSKMAKLPLGKLANLLDEKLYQQEWFVTGQVDPSFFHEDFEHYHQDDSQWMTMLTGHSGEEPLKLMPSSSLESYVEHVQTMFDPNESRAQVICTEVAQEEDADQKITCTWRLSGRTNLLWGLDLKPILVQTDFFIHESTGLIEKQVDRYSIPHWDIFLSAMFPTLTTWGIMSPPADAVAERTVVDTTRQHPVNPVEAWMARAGIMSYFMTPPFALAQQKKEEEEQQQQQSYQEQTYLGTHEVVTTSNHQVTLSKAARSTFEVKSAAHDEPEETTTTLSTAREEALLAAYSDTLPSCPTRPITSEEAARMRAPESPWQTSVNPVEAWMARAGIMSYFMTPPFALAQQKKKEEERQQQQQQQQSYQEQPYLGTHEVATTSNHQVTLSKAARSTFEVKSAAHEEQEETLSTAQEEALLAAYSDTLPSCPTRPITSEEAARMRAPESPWQELLNLLEHSGHAAETEIRAILSDGTQLPAIRSPTWIDKAKLFLPDRAETRENLLEATRRADYRRYHQYYTTTDAAAATQGTMEVVQLEEEDELVEEATLSPYFAE
eukprot:CAMPEP_0172471342 /NCGR_PEP_ID=MMETSP1065-20121228/67767_1 /TAXON_ID=265537 /ORGANISM="Amphiprora paludosa, Strain CCMP125" /LENGTH=641 /DNA_ID=CAMNT_0013229437 /DNA_START=106 /DNA_END=2032 /DNA_ORIENTATION=+